MKRYFFLIIFSIPFICLAADKTKTIFNPHTGNLDYITRVSSTSVGELLDFSTFGYTNGQIPVYNSTTSKFQPGLTVLGSSESLNQLTVGTITVRYGISWINGVQVSSPLSGGGNIPSIQNPTTGFFYANDFGVGGSSIIWTNNISSVGIRTPSPTSALDVFNGSVTIRGNRSAISVATISFVGTNSYRSSYQSGPSIEILSSTIPDAAISTMTVSFSTRPYLYVIIYATHSTSATGDILVRFNNDASNSYSCDRLIGNTATSSTTAVGLPIYGVTNNFSTATLRSVRMEVFDGIPNAPKIGTWMAVAASTQTIATQRSTGSFMWGNTVDAVNTISVHTIQYNGPVQPGGAAFKVGSYINVLGRDY